MDARMRVCRNRYNIQEPSVCRSYWQKRRKKERLCRNPVTLHYLGKVMRVTPSLLQRGRQHAGSIPLTPFLPFRRLSREFLVILQRAIVFFMNALSGAEAKVAAGQKERQNNFPMISSKPKEHHFYQKKNCGQGESIQRCPFNSWFHWVACDGIAVPGGFLYRA